MIIGTAGHIDHGKTALVRALTGVDTDRLKEEKERGISIDLGFAYLPAGDGGILGFVDVPGHEKFVRNMLAGATGIDFVLLVVAADDGIMPQTREHLATSICRSTRGLVALTKIDLAPPERCAEVAQNVREMLQTTGLKSAQVVPVSANTGEGIADLRDRLQAAAPDAAPRSALGRFRLAVDRCFSLTGVGTVVTGAVLSGAIAVGDTGVVSPGGLRARALITQNAPQWRRAALRAQPRRRGIDKRAIARGAVVLDPILHAREPHRCDGATARNGGQSARALDARAPVSRGSEVAGASRCWRKTRSRPVAAAHPARAGSADAAAVRDRFILRDTSGSRTLGGGCFVDLRAAAAPPPAAAWGSSRRWITTTRAALATSLERWPFFMDVSAFARDRTRGGADSGGPARSHVRLPVGGNMIALSPGPGSASRLRCARRRRLSSHHPELPSLRVAGGAVQPRLRHNSRRRPGFVEEGSLVMEGGAMRSPGHRFFPIDVTQACGRASSRSCRTRNVFVPCARTRSRRP
jgi:selenocysteine-specific elongation factor